MLRGRDGGSYTDPAIGMTKILPATYLMGCCLCWDKVFCPGLPVGDYDFWQGKSKQKSRPWRATCMYPHADL